MKKHKKALHRTRSTGKVFRMNRRQESGQTIVLMALALVGLLVSTGLAVDGAMLMVRKAQLDRAVDAAALAGVVKVGGVTNLTELSAAHSEGQIVMAANGVPIANPVNCPEQRNWQSHDYCGTASLGTVPGAVRYHVEAAWFSKTYFVSLVGITQIPIISEATAEYLTLVDIYASDTTERGLLNLSNQSMFGPGRSMTQGDPYSAALNPSNTNWKDLTGAYTYRIRVPSDYPYDKVRVEIFDPDTYNQKQGVATSPETAKPVYRIDGSSTTKWCDFGTEMRYPWNACAVTTRQPGQTTAEPNDHWFFRADEIRWSHTGISATGADAMNASTWQSQYPAKYPVTTMFRLFYLKQAPDGSLSEVDLAYYISGADSHTDMMWVSPGAPASERMPAFGTDTPGTREADSPITRSNEIQEVFTELGIESQGSLPSRAEPETFTEDCNAYREAHYGPTSENSWSPFSNYWRFTMANECAPNTTNPTGNSDFIVDLDDEAKGIYVDPNSGIRDIYMQVRTLFWFSENGFGFWAGPPRTAEDADDFLYTVPAEVNARQTYIVAAETDDIGYQLHRSNGVAVFGIGHLPMNTMFTSQKDDASTPTVNEAIPSDLPLTYLGPEFAGRKIKIAIFDPDAGATGPMVFHFDTINDTDWSICFKSQPTPANPTSEGNCAGQAKHVGEGVLLIENDNGWSTAEFTLPSDSSGDRVPFYGGRLYARYFTGQGDTFVWKITTEGRPYLVK